MKRNKRLSVDGFILSGISVHRCERNIRNVARCAEYKEPNKRSPPIVVQMSPGQSKPMALKATLGSTFSNIKASIGAIQRYTAEDKPTARIAADTALNK